MWEELYENYYKELVAYGTYMCGDKDISEDLVQETFVKALINAGKIVDLSVDKQRAWLYRTFKNLFFDLCRRAVLENEFKQNLKPEYFEDSEIQKIENSMFLQSISPLDRAIFQLRYFEGYSAKEISQIMNIPQGTIRSKLSRCRKTLKNDLEL